MADEEKEKPETSSETSIEETGEEKEKGNEDTGSEEPKIPLSRLRAESKKVKTLREELTKLQTSGQDKETSTDDIKGRKDEEARIRELIAKIGTEKTEEEKRVLSEYNSKIEDLKVIDPSLNVKQLEGIIEKYGFTDPDKAFKLYQDSKGGKTPVIKPKTLVSKKTSDDVKEEDFDATKVGSIHEAIQKGLKKFGVGK